MEEVLRYVLGLLDSLSGLVKSGRNKTTGSMEDVSLFDYDIYLRRASRCEMNHCHILLESKLKWPFKLNSKRVKGLFMHEFIHYVQQDELGDTYNNIVQCICASGSLVRYRPTTVAFVLTRAFFSAFLNY